MAPRGTPKASLQIERFIGRSNVPRTKSPINTSKTISVVKSTETIALKEKNINKQLPRLGLTAVAKDTKELRSSRISELATPRSKKTLSVKAVTPKSNLNKQAPPASVTRSGKKATWKKRPKPAHSGVPVPEKMKKLLAKYLQDENEASKM